MLLETYTDEARPEVLKIQEARDTRILADQSVQLAEWAARILIGAEQLGIKTRPVTRIPVSATERAVLATIAATSANLRKKLSANRPTLTVGEVGGLLIAVAEAMLDAAPLRGFALILIAKNLMNCRDQEVIGLRTGPRTKTVSVNYERSRA